MHTGVYKSHCNNKTTYTDSPYPVWSSWFLFSFMEVIENSWRNFSLTIKMVKKYEVKLRQTSV